MSYKMFVYGNMFQDVQVIKPKNNFTRILDIILIGLRWKFIFVTTEYLYHFFSNILRIAIMAWTLILYFFKVLSVNQSYLKIHTSL